MANQVSNVVKPQAGFNPQQVAPTAVPAIGQGLLGFGRNILGGLGVVGDAVKSSIQGTQSVPQGILGGGNIAGNQGTIAGMNGPSWTQSHPQSVTTKYNETGGVDSHTVKYPNMSYPNMSQVSAVGGASFDPQNNAQPSQQQTPQSQQQTPQQQAPTPFDNFVNNGQPIQTPTPSYNTGTQFSPPPIQTPAYGQSSYSGQPQPTGPTAQGLIGNLMNLSQPSAAQQQALQQSQSAQQAYQQAIAALNQSRQNEAQGLADIQRTPIPLEFQQGRGQILQNQYQQQQAAFGAEAQAAASLYSPAISAAMTGTGQQISAAQSAAGYTPEALRYGALGNGAGGTGGLDPQSQANQLAQLVASGQMSLPAAEAQMQSYGTIGAPTLRNAILQTDPNFNFAQAQAFSGVQGQVAPQLGMAQAAINNLQNTFANLPDYQKTGIPALNALNNLLASVGVGTGTQQSKSNALSEARTQVSTALGVATNTTPSSWTNTVYGWFPDNATPDQVAAGIQQFSNLAANRQNIYGTPGVVQPFNSVSPQSQGAAAASSQNYANSNPAGWFPN